MSKCGFSLVLLAGVLVAAGWWWSHRVDARTDPGSGPEREVGWSAPQLPANAVPSKSSGREHRRAGKGDWKTRTYWALADFVTAETIAAKARHVIGRDQRVGEMTAFYGEPKVDESDTPLEAFSHFKLSATDTGRGIFLMRYERPNHVEMSELFRPVSPWQTPDLSLTAYEVRQNRAGNAVRVLAFFKEESGRMLLDWDVYTQTKYRTLRHFAIQTPRGHRQVFRVKAQEVPQEGSPTDRLFRFSDPAHDQDHVEIPVRSDTPSGRILSELAFSNSSRQARARYATVELGWTQEETPRMVLHEVLCWEFLGLGGERGNTNPTGP